MKISNSKKQLAEIIHENGGWREEAEHSVSSCNGTIAFSKSKPRYTSKYGWTTAGGFIGSRIELCSYLKNWHQTLLSRDEYFHLYPAPEPTPDPVVETKPTIEQLAADYRNRKGYADRKQEEADAAKADAEAKLAELVAAGKALGLVLSVAGVEPGAGIADRRDLRVGDEVECAESNIKRDKYNGMVGRLHLIDEGDTYTPYLVDFGGEAKIWCHEVKFIRRP